MKDLAQPPQETGQPTEEQRNLPTYQTRVNEKGKWWSINEVDFYPLTEVYHAQETGIDVLRKLDTGEYLGLGGVDAAAQALLRLIEEKVIGAGEKAIKAWEEHAYSLDSLANDQLVYLKHPNSDQKRRDNDVTDRREILLAYGVLAEQRSKLRELLGGQ